jgi:hypothetical protein
MFDRLKFGASALIGLGVGVVLALPFFWFGVKNGVNSLHHHLQGSFATVERRQQGMADSALRVEKILASKGWRGNHGDFARVELLRSRMAGTGDFEERIEVAQDLERALLNAGVAVAQAAEASEAIGGSAYVADFLQTWRRDLRYLVDEEATFAGGVKQYNRVLRTWPVPAIIGNSSFAQLVKSSIRGLRDRAGEILRWAFSWVKWTASAVSAKLRGKDKPEHPAPLAPQPWPHDTEHKSLAVPYFIAEAPVPEEDYREIQYSLEGPDMSDVDSSEDKVEYEGKKRAPFVAPVPTVQKTATYR